MHARAKHAFKLLRNLGKRVQARPRQIASASQTVVACADDDGVVIGHGSLQLASVRYALDPEVTIQLRRRRPQLVDRWMPYNEEETDA